MPRTAFLVCLLEIKSEQLLLSHNNEVPEQLRKSNQFHKYKVQDLLLSRARVSIFMPLFKRIQWSSGKAVCLKKIFIS